MDAEGISIGIGSGVAIVALKEVFSWLRAKYAKTEIPQPLRSTIDGEVRTQKSPQYVTVGECNRRMCEHTAEIQNLRDEVINGQKEIVSKLDELDKALQELIRQAQQNGTGSQGDYSSNFRWPLEPQFHRITTYYGYDPWRNGNHGGIDVVGSGVPVGNANIHTVQSGTVIKVSNTCPHDYSKYYSCGCGGGWGNYIVVDHGGGGSTLYAHGRKIFVSAGQQVTRGDVIGLVGCTGWSTGDHLHFEVRENGYRVDPFKYEYSDY